MLFVMTVFAAADVARRQDVVEWFDSELAVGDVAVNSACLSRGPCTPAVEQHDGPADEPATGAATPRPAEWTDR